MKQTSASQSQVPTGQGYGFMTFEKADCHSSEAWALSLALNRD